MSTQQLPGPLLLDVVELAEDLGDDEVVLLPLNKGSNMLETIAFRRNVDSHFKLGTSSFKSEFIDSPLSRALPANLLEVTTQGGKVLVKKNFDADQTQRQLAIGSTICMVEQYLLFTYLLITKTTFDKLEQKRSLLQSGGVGSVGGEDSQRKRKKKSKRNDEKQQKKAVFQNAASCFDCPICYETMASTCTLSPCGCNFCFECIHKWYVELNKFHCPCCKQRFDLGRCSLNKRFDSLIEELLSQNEWIVSEKELWKARQSLGISRYQLFQLSMKKKSPFVFVRLTKSYMKKLLVLKATNHVQLSQNPVLAADATIQQYVADATEFLARQHEEEFLERMFTDLPEWFLKDNPLYDEDYDVRVFLEGEEAVEIERLDTDEEEEADEEDYDEEESETEDEN